jgi:hypothetical protein
VNCSRLLFTVASFLVVLVALVAGRASAQSAESGATFGIATEVAQVIVATEFASANANDGWDHSELLDPTTGFLIRGSGTAVTWYAPVRLPAGAVVTRVELAACGAPTGAVQFVLLRSKLPPGSGLEEVSAPGSTGSTSGCARFSVTPNNPPLVIDNLNATYWIRASTEGGSGFDSVRVFYRLQVSPAPGTATFGDVPTSHPFFQFVEALVASGITAGCGGGNYCPDAPLTRGQMAAFLSKALGLHFAP